MSKRAQPVARCVTTRRIGPVARASSADACPGRSRLSHRRRCRASRPSRQGRAHAASQASPSKGPRQSARTRPASSAAPTLSSTRPANAAKTPASTQHRRQFSAGRLPSGRTAVASPKGPRAMQGDLEVLVCRAALCLGSQRIHHRTDGHARPGSADQAEQQVELTACPRCGSSAAFECAAAERAEASRPGPGGQRHRRRRNLAGANQRCDPLRIDSPDQRPGAGPAGTCRAGKGAEGAYPPMPPRRGGPGPRDRRSAPPAWASEQASKRASGPAMPRRARPRDTPVLRVTRSAGRCRRVGWLLTRFTPASACLPRSARPSVRAPRARRRRTHRAAHRRSRPRP
jgi:hypothetical protein